MNKEIHHRGVPGRQYGIWNTVKSGWDFDVCEDTPMLANARLYQKIGDKAKDKRYEPRILPSKRKEPL